MARPARKAGLVVAKLRKTSLHPKQFERKSTKFCFSTQFQHNYVSRQPPSTRAYRRFLRNNLQFCHCRPNSLIQPAIDMTDDMTDDIIICHDVLNHLYGKALFLSLLADYLAGGGIVFMSFLALLLYHETKDKEKIPLKTRKRGRLYDFFYH